MSQDIATIERHLASKDKQVRLKALKLLLRHPDATPIQLVRCLCSEDNRDFEFLEIFELGSAMRESWSRFRGVTDDEVYEYLSSLYAGRPDAERQPRGARPGASLHAEGAGDAGRASGVCASGSALVS